MNISDNNRPSSFRQICIVLVCLTIVYSAIVQDKYFSISNGMLLLGGTILVTLYLANCKGLFDFRDILIDENKSMLLYMAYMLFVGLAFSQNIISHISQWFTCLEYMFFLVVISLLIIQTGSDIFYITLLLVAIALAIVFIDNPVYYGGGRYSISINKNPNALGMSFTTGIWVVLYLQQKKRMPLILGFAMIAVFGYCIIMTGSRKSMIAAGLVISLWIMFCFLPNLWEERGARSLILFIITIIAIAALWYGFMNIYKGSVIANRMNLLTNEVVEGNRSNMYREGFELFKLNPLFGSGFQSFRFYYGSYSHATIIEIPVSGGIFGTLLYFNIYLLSIIKCLRIFRETKTKSDFATEHAKIRMILILWAIMLFYTICIIHQYQFDSFVIFGIIFGQTTYIERKLDSNIFEESQMRKGRKYIKYV